MPQESTLSVPLELHTFSRQAGRKRALSLEEERVQRLAVGGGGVGAGKDGEAPCLPRLRLFRRLVGIKTQLSQVIGAKWGTFKKIPRSGTCPTRPRNEWKIRNRKDVIRSR